MYVIIFEYSLSAEHDNEIAFISCKEIDSPETPVSGQYSKENNCYYEWYKTYDDYQEAVDAKNRLVDQYKPYMMIRKEKKKYNSWKQDRDFEQSSSEDN